MNNAEIHSCLTAGDMTTFGEAWKKYYKTMYALAYSLLKDPEDACDAVQDVFVKLCSRPDLWHDITDMRGYLMVCVRNGCLYKLRHQQSQAEKSKKYMAWEEQGVLIEQYADPRGILSKEREIILHHLLRRQPKKRRIVVQLYYFEGLTYRQICDRLSISVDTVKTQLRLARCSFEGMRHLLYFVICLCVFKY